MSQVRRFRKKPVYLEVIHFATYKDALDIAEWCGGGGAGKDEHGRLYVDVPTRDGSMRAHIGDYIMKDDSGEFEPMQLNLDEFFTRWDEVTEWKAEAG
jgi:hypothetical protein